MRVGFVGVGAIGKFMAARLRQAGHELYVVDADAAAADTFVADGGVRIDSAKRLADEVETIFYSLPHPEIVREVTLGDEGVIHGSRARIIVDLSTTGPLVAAEVAAVALRHGKQMLDGPVSGGTAGAAKGTVAIMAAGPRQAFDEVKPLLDIIGKVFFVGESVGQGQTMKLLNNMLSATALAATAEIAVLGARAGLDADTMIEVLNASSGQNTHTRDKFPKAVLPRTFDYGFRIDLLMKDIRLCSAFAEKLGVPLRVCDEALNTWELTVPEFGSQDFTNIVRLLESEVGVQVVGRDAHASEETVGR